MTGKELRNILDTYYRSNGKITNTILIIMTAKSKISPHGEDLKELVAC